MPNPTLNELFDNPHLADDSSNLVLSSWDTILLQIFSFRHLENLTAANWVSFDFNVSYSSCWGYSLRWGWVLFERTWILSRIHFTMYFIEILVVETKRFVSSTVNVILTRQACGQRSSRTAGSKHQAVGNHFFERFCYVFLISKCRADWDLGLCTTSGLAFGEPQRNGKIRFFLRQNTFPPRILPLRCGSTNTSTEVAHKLRSWSPLHFEIRNI